MTSPLADRLRVARHEGFVGRPIERALFESALAATELPFHVMYVYGPGGIGKTSLLSEFAYSCSEAKTPVVRLDGRSIEPTPESFLEAVRSAVGLSPQDSFAEIVASEHRRYVILVDTFEMLAQLDTWLFETFLPQLPRNVLTVLAGRNPPSMAQRADPGWHTLVRTIPLRNLDPHESRSLLTRRGVPDEQHQPVLQFTHGHPLALSLVADVFAQRADTDFQPEAEPDVVKILLDRLVQRVPSPAHRKALEISAVIHLTTEGILAKTLDISDAHEIFEWLRELSFMETGVVGIFPHDLARNALTADLRWRDPDWFAEIHERARSYYKRRLQDTHGPEQQRVLLDYIFLHRDSPMVAPFFEWQEGGVPLGRQARPTDLPALRTMVARHEGDESARLLDYWYTRQPRGLLVFRDARDELAGLLSMISLDEASIEHLEADPAAEAAWEYLKGNAPLRPGEAATFFRFWLARDTYQEVSAIQSLIFVNAVRYSLTMPGLAFTFFPCADPDFWEAVCSYSDLDRIPEADFQVGEHRYGVYGHDWRVKPPMAWLDLMGERETADATQMDAVSQPSESLVVLSQPDFVEAVREALRSVTRADVLDSNPLLRSRIVVQRAGSKADRSNQVSALQALLKEAAESLQLASRERRFYDALHHTYFQPASTQEQASELLDLPFSTFRRHLRSGISRVTEILWEQELGGT